LGGTQTDLNQSMLATVMDSQVAELRRGAILERDAQDRAA
jgi:hypothetical protein